MIKTNTDEEWLALRKQYIGGSDASAVIGMNPYRSPYALWAEKTGQVEEFKGNLATDVGTYLEEFVAQEFCKRMARRVRRNNHSIVNDKYPWASANVDREIVAEDALLECKTTSELNLKRFKDIDFPDIYYCQCVHYLAVTGRSRIYLAVLIGNKDFKIYQLDRDEAEIESLMNAERDFWELVKSKTPPPVDGSESSSKALDEIYEHTDTETVDLTAIEDKIKQYNLVKAKISELTKIKDEYTNEFKAFMGNSKYGACAIAKVTMSDRATTSFDKDLLKAVTGHEYSEFVKTTGKSTTCLVKEVKNG
jgi:putative phage-type endonuclease